MYTASKWTQQQEYHFSFYEIPVSEALAIQIGFILKYSCKGNILTKYSKRPTNVRYYDTEYQI